MAEIYDIKIKGKGIVDISELKCFERYDWTDKQTKTYLNKYVLPATAKCNVMAGCKGVLDLLKAEGHELIVVTKRGWISEAEIDSAKAVFMKNNLKFDKYFWNVESKSKICKQEKIDIYIEDYDKFCLQLQKEKIMTLYLRDIDMPKLKTSKYLKQVNDWGQIYRAIKEINKL